MPKDRVTQSHQGYGFVEFLAEDDADYAIKIMNMIKLYGKPIRVNKVKICSIRIIFNFKFMFFLLLLYNSLLFNIMKINTFYNSFISFYYFCF